MDASDQAADGKFNLKVTLLRKLPIPLPPLAEQRAIARVLDTARAAVDAEAGVVQALRELKRSLMRYLFTYGPVPVDQADAVALQETEVGLIWDGHEALPSGWRWLHVGDLGKIITGRTPSTKIPQHFGGPYPFVTPADLEHATNVYQSDRTLSSSGLNAANRLRKNAVLVTCIGTVGKTGILRVPNAATNQQINAIECGACAFPEFVCYLMSHGAPLLRSRARQTTVPILSKSNFASLPVPLPPLEEQHVIAAQLSAVDEAIAAHEDRRLALEALFNSLLERLMRGELRVTPTPVDLQSGGTP